MLKSQPGFTTFNPHSIKLAQQAVFYFENMVNLHTDPVPEYITKYHQRYLFSSNVIPAENIIPDKSFASLSRGCRNTCNYQMRFVFYIIHFDQYCGFGEK